MLSVRGGAKAVEFYKVAFGAGELFRIEAPDGAVVAQLSVGESEFWVADESPEHKNFSPESLSAEFRGGATVRMVMVVADPDAVFARAVKAGAIVISPSRIKNTAGPSGGLSIRLDIIGRLGSRWVVDDLRAWSVRP